MPSSPVDELIRLAGVKKPHLAPNAEDWVRVEKEIGVSLPNDYKALVSAVGEGYFGFGIYLLSPTSSSSYVRLSHEALVAYPEPIRNIEADLGLSFYPEPDGLIRIGGIDRQDFLLKCEGGRAVSSTLVWLDIDLQEIREISMSLTQFLHDGYLGKIRDVGLEELVQYLWQSGTREFFTPQVVDEAA